MGSRGSAMTCRDVQEMLGAHLDGELENARAAEVEAHTGSCADCSAAYAQLSDLGGMLRDAVLLPAEIAEAEGRFDGLWAGIEAGLTAGTTDPAERPGLWRRLHVWWAAQPRQIWAPAMAAAAILLVVFALVLGRSGPDAEPGGETPGVKNIAHAPAGELPPFAGPRVLRPMVAESPEGGDPVSPAPRRRDREEMVAHNEAFIVSYEVDRGIVLIDHDPEEPDQPIVVWHLLPEDVEADGDPI